ncbi:alkaline phosphatase D family protein [Microbulbifer sp. Q7]|uniref:alkaline phosphatase D family protein n=1 Tax=Microbulbifer sp. Q7 TaxID=1785091 RepID=UPI00082C6773|nr:alkaline phosphatase D family protein [Microbulbifer sp. Q7]
MKRRSFLKLGSGAALAPAISPSLAVAMAAARPKLVETTPLGRLPNGTQHWLGGHLWGNRLQDWHCHNGRLECLQGDKTFEVRTAAILTRELANTHKPGRIRARVGLMTPDAKGFCGFLLGVGAGKLDYRGAALAQRAGGTNGGFMAVLDESGNLGFRDFSDQDNGMGFTRLEREGSVSISQVGQRKIQLDCHIDPVENGRFDVRLVASDAQSGEEFGFAVRTEVPAEQLTGGIMLVSSPPTDAAGARWWFSDIETGGDKITAHPDRKLGPVMGCMHSLNCSDKQAVLKLSAQFMPIDLVANSNAVLEYRTVGQQQWQTGAERPIEDGYVAAFRIAGWDASKDHEYRVRFAGSAQALYSGTIARDPGQSRPLKIALYSCIIPTAKSLDEPAYSKLIPEERILGRYTEDNIFFPHNTLVSHCDTHQPDLYVFAGDQYYETYPTRYGRDTPQAKLDTLYRWYLWYWTFRESVRNRPSILLVDDHDVLQGNLWGNKGDATGGPREEDGGFKHDIELVKMVYRIQSSHTPDAYDPTPIRHGIPVTYAHFVYGGTSFAMVEDRKFKSAPDYEADRLTVTGELLGRRQEQFLRDWASMDPGLPKICLTASIWGSPQTDEEGNGLVDYDANCYPPDGRTRAVKLVEDAKALVLAGDQHLGLVARQYSGAFPVGDESTGALFFSGPASAAFWQRWFEGMGKLENAIGDDPNTGHFTDPFGNNMRVLAAANPKITHAEFSDDNTTWGKFVADRNLKSEGYGIAVVDHAKGRYQLECWPWDANPARDRQFAGWPQVHPIESSESPDSTG